MKISLRKKQDGFLILAAVILIVVVGSFMAALTYMFIGSTRSSQHHLASSKAFYIAQSGLERARYAITASPVAVIPVDQRVSCQDIDFTETFGEGEFHVVGSNNNPTPAVALTAAISAAESTEIFVTDTSSYATEGWIQLGDELIYYTGTTSTSFTGLTRGDNGTIAVAHPVGQVVGQNLCHLISTGAVPSLANPQGKRTVEWYIFGGNQNAFAVGDQDSPVGELIAEFNGDEWERKQTNITADRNLNSISMSSAFDGWAVGEVTNDNVPFIVHYDGTLDEWLEIGPTTFDNDIAIDRALFGVSCVNTDFCWAVGASSNKAPALIAEWDGTHWFDIPDSNPGKRNFGPKGLDLYGISCPDVTKCWAVGQKSGGRGGHGLIMEYDEGTDTWTDFSSTNNNNSAAQSLQDVYCVTPDDCWAVGDAGTIAYYDGSTWEDKASPTGKQLLGVVCTSTDNCWAVGQKVGNARGTILHYTNTGAPGAGTWTESGFTNNSKLERTAPTLQAVDCFNENDCWAVGQGGTFVHYDGGTNTWTGYRYVHNGLPEQNGVGINDISLVVAPGNGKALWHELFHPYDQP